MEYKIEQYERCETMHDGSIEDILIGVTKPSMDRLLKMQSPGDCIALYAFYCYVRKWQKNSNVFATSEYAMKALDWGRDRFSRAKSQLVEEGFISDVKVRTEENRIDGWYVKVRYAMNSTLGKFHTTEIPQGGKTSDKYPLMVNEIPFNGKQIQERDEKKKELKASSEEFDSFYSSYPKKVAKPNARKAWDKNKCNLEQVLPALEKHKKTWSDPQFIPHPATWLNQRRWEDETIVKQESSAPKGRMTPAEAVRQNGWTDEFWTWLHGIMDRTDIQRDYLTTVEDRWLVEFIAFKKTNGYF
jgi:hypothetical protein